MKATKILEVLDLTYEARQQGRIFNPMFVGEAGVGKSAVIRQWVDDKRIVNSNFGFRDFRMAYYEGPDFIGMPVEQMIEGVMRMIHALPGFWPTEGEGLILLEEPNRGNTMIMNCLMQILTDREVGTDYKLPDGWLIAGAMNPEGSRYDTNNMDTALADRFTFYDIDYDTNTFISHIEKKQWHQNVQLFLRSGIWQYKKPDSIAKGGKYISPRTWERMETVEQAGEIQKMSQANHRTHCQAILGKDIGSEYWKTCWDDAPVVASDLLKDAKAAIWKLKKQSKEGKSYAGDKVSLTIESIVEHYGGYYTGCDFKKDPKKIEEKLMVAVAMVIPADQAVNLVRDCGFKFFKGKGKVTSFMKEFTARNPQCTAFLRHNVQVAGAIGKKGKTN